MSTNTESAHVTGPIECQPWCEDQDGHADETFTADQVCFGAESWVWMSKAGVDVSGDGVTQSAIGVHLQNIGGESYIALNPDRITGLLQFTADEADALAALLTAHAAELRPS
jgi:hypothetical protein